MSKIYPLQNHLKNLSYLKINKQKIKIIDNDLARNNKKFNPSKGWMEINAGIIDHHEKAKPNIENLLYSYCGYAKKAITEVDIFWYRSFLEDIDQLELSKDIFNQKKEYKKLTVSDLAFFLDLNFIYSFIDQSKVSTKVIEVGGGYGRLAEICQHILPGKIKHFLIDSVPTSLSLAYEYLTIALPNHKIGSFYENENLMDLDLDIYILPSWRSDLLPKEYFDLAINIQSMQEMDKHHIDFYMELFDKTLITNQGLIYLCNRRDHIYKGSWDFPKNWACLQKQKSPRSWIRDMPSELFEKRSRDFSKSQLLANNLYNRTLNNSDEKQLKEAKLKCYKPY